MSVDEARKKKKNKMRKRYILRSAVLALLIGLTVYALYSNHNKDKEIYQPGDEAPDFELTQINDQNEMEKVRMSELQGKGVMLNFWATYCEPCEKEIPYMQSLYPDYKDDIEIVAVSLDTGKLVVDDFIDKYDLTFPIPHDKQSEVRGLYNVKPIPSTFFIDEDGIIVDKVEGALTLDKLEDYFKEIQPQ